MNTQHNEEGMINISWTFIMKAVAWFIPVALAGAMLYLRSEFVTRQHVDDVFQPVSSLPQRVNHLESFRVQHEAFDAETAKTAGQIQQDIAGLKAQVNGLKEQSTKDTDRILQRLDMMQRNR